MTIGVEGYFNSSWVTVFDGNLTHTFYLTPRDQTPPSTPEILTPEDSSSSETSPLITWTEAEDNSSVTYVLQIDDTNISLDTTSYQTNLSGTHTTRVMAEDEYGNKGEFSDQISFTVEASCDTLRCQAEDAIEEATIAYQAAEPETSLGEFYLRLAGSFLRLAERELELGDRVTWFQDRFYSLSIRHAEFSERLSERAV